MVYDLNAFRTSLGNTSKRIPSNKIVAWVNKHFEAKSRKGGDELVICNPFNGDTNFKFNISIIKASCHCWTGDEWAGPTHPVTGKRNCSFIKFVKLFKRCSYTEAVKDVLGTVSDISAYLRPENRQSDAKPLRKVSVALPDGTERLIGASDPQAKLLIKWLMSRGYTLQEIEDNDIHFLGMEVYWPFFEFDELIYWQSRDRLNKTFRFPDIKIVDKKGDTIAETEGSKGDFLYGFDDCDPANFIIITESIFGKNTIGAQTLASGGAILTENQIGKIKIIGPKNGVILSPDNDAAGIKSIIANHKLLLGHGYPLFYSIPPKIEYLDDDNKKFTKDWNELLVKLRMTKNEIRQLHDQRIKKLNPKGLLDLLRLL